MTIAEIIAISTEIITLVSVVIPVYKNLRRITNGTKCQLRTEMLKIYYKHKGEKKVRQYEFENFVKLYEAYKALGGNSFIDKVHKEVMTWEVIS